MQATLRARAFFAKNGKFDDQNIRGKFEKNDFPIDFSKIYLIQNLMLISMQKNVKNHDFRLFLHI